MSDIKLCIQAVKKAMEDNKFDVTYHQEGTEAVCFEGLTDDLNDLMGSEIFNQLTQSPWVKIEDAELVDGERYDIFDGEYQFVGVYSVDVNSSAFITDLDIIPDNDITHVIHLPKPTPPSEL